MSRSKHPLPSISPKSLTIPYLKPPPGAGSPAPDVPSGLFPNVPTHTIGVQPVAICMTGEGGITASKPREFDGTSPRSSVGNSVATRSGAEVFYANDQIFTPSSRHAARVLSAWI